MSRIVQVGIPIEEVGKRVKELTEAIKKHDMDIGAESSININIGPKEEAISATLTVYFLKDIQEAR